MELFKDLKGYEDEYQVSTLGRFWSKAKKKIMKVGKHKSNSGYVQIMLYKNGEYHWKYVHRLVATTFLPNPEHLRTINHKDGNKTNNVLTNLEWMDDEQQQRHAFMMGLKKNGGVMMSEKEIYKIYELFFEKHIYPRKISEMLNKPFGTIRKICYGERCKDLLRKYRDKVSLQKN